MKIVKQSVDIIKFNAQSMLSNIEKAGRTCYKSEAKITKDSTDAFIKMIIKRGHESVLEHEKITARIVCDRAVSHEIVRHRLASFSQESTRYVNYKEGIEVIKPPFAGNKRERTGKEVAWTHQMNAAERTYKALLDWGCTPQIARSVLPNALKTEIVVTANLREWRHILNLRCSPAAHPQIREISFMLLKGFMEKVPVIFNDIYKKYKKDYAVFLAR